MRNLKGFKIHNLSTPAPCPQQIARSCFFTLHMRRNLDANPIRTRANRTSRSREMLEQRIERVKFHHIPK